MEQSNLSQVLYDNTSDLYKSLGYTLLSEADNDDKSFVDSFEGLTEKIVSAVDDPSKAWEVANMVKRIYKREYRNPNYVDTPIIGCVDHLMSKLDSCHLSDVQIAAKDKLENALQVAVNEAVKELHESESTGFNPNPYNIYENCPFDVMGRETTRGLIQLYEAVTDTEIMEALMNLGRLNIAMESQFYVTEGNAVAKKAREISRKANKAEAKVIQSAGGTISQIRKAGKEAVTPMEKFINGSIEKIKKADANERRNIIIKGGILPKVWRWIKRGIVMIIGGAAGVAFSPAAVATGIAFIGWVTSDKFLDKRERAKILRELEDEIQIVNEKIDDSRGDENKQKKYELMRIRNDLKRTQDKIRLGLRY